MTEGQDGKDNKLSPCIFFECPSIFTTCISTTDPNMDSSTNDSAQPIALRRIKRRASVLSPIKPSANIDTRVTTPTRKRAPKRVRFSEGDVSSTTSTLAAGTTGLTPAVGRANLHIPKSRRTATPAPTRTVVSSSPAYEYEYVQFTPLRQALDERCKRRIRRNHLSEEVNSYEADKRGTALLRHEIKKKDAELQKLKTELDDSKAAKTTQETSEADSKATQTRVAEIEEELETLRRSFSLSATANVEEETWDHVPRKSNGPGSEGGDTILIYEDDADPYQQQEEQANVQDQVDAAIMGLELESARQAKQSMLSSFSRNNRSFDTQLDFADSPSKSHDTTHPANIPATPRTLYHNLSKQLKAATSRAEDAELALTALEGEVRALGFNHPTNIAASASLTTLADHFRTIRLDLERLMPGETTLSFQNSELFPELMRKFKGLIERLHSRDVELKSLRNQERSLKGNFDHALVAADKADAKIKSLEKALDEMAESSMESRIRAQELERQRNEKSKDVEKLQVALQKYRDEVDRLETLIGKVETEHKDVMQQVKDESATAWERVEDMSAKVSAEETGRRKAEESAVSRLKRIQDLETSLTQARENAEKVQERLATGEQHSKNHIEEVTALNSRISGLSTALASANAEVDKLRQINGRLEQQYRTEVAQGEKAVSRMHEELIRAATRITEAGKGYKRGSKVRLANWELESDDFPVDEEGVREGEGGLLTPGSTVRFADYSEVEDQMAERERGRSEDADGDGFESGSESLPASVEIRRGKHGKPRSLTPALAVKPAMSVKTKRGKRRYDSGIGMSPLGESDGEVDSGLGTSEMGSDGMEMDVC